MGILISKAIEYNIITNETAKLIPNKCKCGADLEFSDSLRELHCTNEYCRYSLIARIQEFNSRLNLELNTSDIESIIQEFNIITPYQLIKLTDDEIQESEQFKRLKLHDENKFKQNVKNVKQTEYLLYEIVEFCGIENISNIASKIFRGFKNIESTYKEIESGQLTFLNERLGIRDTDSSIISLKILGELINIKEELIFAESSFKIKNSTKKVLNIAIADNTRPFLNINELLDYLNYTYDYEFNHVTNISDTTDILIRNTSILNNKFRIARIINDRYVAELVNNNKMSLSDIGKINESELKPIGSKIYIDTLEKILSRLDKLR